MSLSARILSWALIFILRLRFPPGKTLVTVDHDFPALPFRTAVEHDVADEFQFNSVWCTAAQRLVQSFPSNKAPGHDKVSMKVIKDALPCILLTLTEIVNCSLWSSVFPTCWKRI